MLERMQCAERQGICMEKMKKKKLPIGVDSFDKIREEDFYYIDKTGLIKEILDNWGEVNLITRPRRFGKSLNMNMLKNFFQLDCKKELFDGTEIAKETKLCDEFMGRFPVILVSLKDACGGDFETACNMMCNVMGIEASRFSFLEESTKLNEDDKALYKQIALLRAAGENEPDNRNILLTRSIQNLSQLLCKHYGKKVVILIDEYDVPLAKAFDRGYYDQMVDLIRNMFGAALKTNDSLQFAVLTGCLRISKESIFTGLNNLKVLTIADARFDEYFGFTDEEVRELLDYYELPQLYDTVKEWYDGYHFGNVNVYCPWDVINYCDAARANPSVWPEEYWSNSSGNDVVRHFIEMANGTTRREIEQLIAGDAVVKEVRQELTYRELYDSIENVWSVLFMTGYLTQQGSPEGKKFRLVIPNTEIRNIFTDQIMSWFKTTTRQDGETLNAFCDAFQNGDTAKIQTLFNAYLKKTISIRDTFVRKEKKENFYHGILIGLLGYKDTWSVWSNRESGDGYSDILVEIEDNDIGIVAEVKYADSVDKLEAVSREALEQIETMNYQEELEDLGITEIRKYGIACYKKRCFVMQG